MEDEESSEGTEVSWMQGFGLKVLGVGSGCRFWPLGLVFRDDQGISKYYCGLDGSCNDGEVSLMTHILYMLTVMVITIVALVA